MGFLASIVSDKRTEVEARRRRVPTSELRQRACAVRPRSFLSALKQPGTRVIAELKARTPTINSFPCSDSLEALAPLYERSGACAISVVVDEKRFGSSLGLLSTIRSAVSLPVLAKEFVIDEYQVIEARAAGADAILLIADILDGARLTSLHATTVELGMSALVEVHDEAGLGRAVEAGARIIGVNNRDLDRMAVNLDTSRHLIPRIPAGVVRVCESGISTRAQIEEMAGVGADVFLVGGAILSAADPAAKIAELLGTNRSVGEGGAA